MKRRMSSLVLLLLTPITSAVAQTETLNFKLTLDWRAIRSVERRGHVTVDYLRQGDDLNKPKERFAYQNGALRGKHTPEEEFNTLKADQEKRCPGATEWNVIAQDESSILYEQQSSHCLDSPDSHVIVRILHGKHNFFSLVYVSIGPSIEPETRKKWVSTLEDAAIEFGEKNAKSMAPLDVDETIPFEIDKVMAALKPAMESESCNVKEATDTRVECKRPRNNTGANGDFGGESVTAVLEAQGSSTHVRITTGKGVIGRLGKKTCSMTVFDAMLKNLRTPSH